MKYLGLLAQSYPSIQAASTEIINLRAILNLPKGTELWVHGHHHEIVGLTPQLLERSSAGELAPFYLLNGTKLLKDIKKGEPVTLDAVDLSGLGTYQLYLDGLKLD